MSKYRQQIESAIALRGTVSVADLADMLGVTDQTIRRIVKPLVDEGVIEKVHGAIRAVENPMTAPFQARMQHNREAKARVAAACVDLIRDGQSVALDTGSTAGFVAQALQVRRNLTVVTNSAYVASTLAMMPGNRVFMAGTQLRDYDGAAFDRAAFETIEAMRVETSILTATCVHPERGLLVSEQCEADIARAMSRIAGQTIFAVDHAKFTAAGSAGLVAVGLTGAALTLVTDRPIPVSHAAWARSIEVIVAP